MIRLRDKEQATTWRLSVVLLAAALVAACGGGTAIAAAKPSLPPGPVTKYRNMLAGQTAGAPIDLIQSILYFSPGAASVVHVHKSSNLATVLQGQVTVKMPSGDKAASAGDALVEPLNQTVQAVNTGSGEAMVLVAFPVPHGGKATAPVAGQAAPATPNKTLYTYTFDLPSITGGYSLVQQVLDFRTRCPNAEAPPRRARRNHGDPGPGDAGPRWDREDLQRGRQLHRDSGSNAPSL